MEFTQEIVLLELLLIISVIAIVVRWIRLPYTIALVLAGLGIGVLHVVPQIELTPHLILVVFLPALLFEAAFHLDWDLLRENSRSIASLAVPGVLLSLVIVGAILAVGVGMPLEVAVVFGALIAATDPVSVMATFRELGAPRRLSVLVEGESLFNDGTALVLVGILSSVALTGEFNVVESVLDFFRVVLGGMALGGVAGYLFSQFTRRLDDYLIEFTLTAVLAYGAFLLGEYLHISGVIATVTAGILVGNYGTRVGMSPTTKITVTSFWEYGAFIANSFIFLLIGLQIDLPLLLQNVGPIVWAIVAVTVARAVTVYLLSFLVNRFGRRIPLRWQHVLFWGGLKGALSLAAVLGLPLDFPHRQTLLVMAFGVVLWSLVVQGITIQPLMVRLRLTQRSPERLEYERRRGQLMATRAAWRELQAMQRDGILSPSVWRALNRDYRRRGRELSASVGELLSRQQGLEQEELVDVWRRCMQRERGTLQDLLRRGLISEEAYRELATEVDRRLDRLAM